MEAAGIVGTPTFWVYEAALLFETNTDKRFREIWVTSCSRETQISRLCERDQMPRDQAVTLLQTQESTEEKCRRATRIIDTEGDLPSIREQVSAHWALVNSHNQMLYKYKY